jgi:DNA-binding PadR family transcriptional regulator
MAIPSKITRGSAELAVLALLEEQSLYGFEIAKRIEERTEGSLRFTMASLYPMLYELENRGLVKGQITSKTCMPNCLPPASRSRKPQHNAASN